MASSEAARTNLPNYPFPHPDPTDLHIYTLSANGYHIGVGQLSDEQAMYLNDLFRTQHRPHKWTA